MTLLALTLSVLFSYVSAAWCCFGKQTRVVQSDGSRCSFIGVGWWNRFKDIQMRLDVINLLVRCFVVSIKCYAYHLSNSHIVFFRFSHRPSIRCCVLYFAKNFTPNSSSNSTNMILLFFPVHIPCPLLVAWYSYFTMFYLSLSLSKSPTFLAYTSFWVQLQSFSLLINEFKLHAILISSSYESSSVSTHVSLFRLVSRQCFFKSIIIHFASGTLMKLFNNSFIVIRSTSGALVLPS